MHQSKQASKLASKSKSKRKKRWSSSLLCTPLSNHFRGLTFNRTPFKGTTSPGQCPRINAEKQRCNHCPKR
ncbi:hypothetical protein M0804_005186 [Polistes exclamans]|nr:hypothetical protein M0804_005186 [Polistes exclamans]